MKPSALGILEFGLKVVGIKTSLFIYKSFYYKLTNDDFRGFGI